MSIEVAVTISLTGFAGILAYIAVNMKDKHSILGWLFLPVSIVLMVVNVFILIEYTTGENIKSMLSTTSLGLLTVLFFVVFYFMLFILTKGFEKMTNSEDKYKNKLEG